MFSIEEQECRMHFISRTNKHGNERVPAATLQLVYRSSNDVLSEFNSDLKASLYPVSYTHLTLPTILLV